MADTALSPLGAIDPNAQTPSSVPLSPLAPAHVDDPSQVSSPALLKPQFDALATKFNVPVNVLMAMQEHAGIPSDPKAAVAQATAAAQSLAAAAQSTGSIPAAVAQQIQDPAAQKVVMARAQDIAQKFYPDQAPPKQAPLDTSWTGTLERRLQGAAEGAAGVAGSALQGAAVQQATQDNVAASIPSPMGQIYKKQLTDAQTALASGLSPATGQPLTAAETAGFQKDAAEAQAGLQALDTNKPKPEVASDSALYKAGTAVSNAPAAVLGAPDPRDQSFYQKLATGAGTMAGFAGALMAAPEGTPAVLGGVLAAAGGQSQGYQDAKAHGASELTADQAASLDGILSMPEAIPIAHGLSAIPAPIRGAVSNAIGRTLAHILVTGGEAGAQQYIQTLGTNMVAKNLYDPQRGITDGATEQGIIGALTGGALTGISHAIAGEQGLNGNIPQAELDAEKAWKRSQGNQTGFGFNKGAWNKGSTDGFGTDEGPNPSQPQIAPTDGQAPPRAVAPQPSPAPDQAAGNPISGADGSSVGEAGALTPAPIASSGNAEVGAPAQSNIAEALNAAGGAPTPNMPAAPTGPATAAAAALNPALTPAAPAAAPQLFPDQKPGNAVRLQLPDGSTTDAVFMGEKPGAVSIRVGGEVFDITPQEFDHAVTGAAAADTAAKKPLSQQAAAQPPAPADIAAQLTTPAPVDTSITPEEAQRQATIIEGQAAAGGWNPALTGAHDQLMSIVNAAKPDAGPANAAEAALTAPGAATTPETTKPASEAPKPAQPAIVGGGSDTPAGTSGLTISPLREKAAVLHGWTGDSAPVVPSVGFQLGKNGEWEFSRAKIDLVKKALGAVDHPTADKAPAAEQAGDGEKNPVPQNAETQGNVRVPVMARSEAMKHALDVVRRGETTSGILPDGSTYSVGQSLDTGNKTGEAGKVFIQGAHNLPKEQHAFNLSDLKKKVAAETPAQGPAEAGEAALTDALRKASEIREKAHDAFDAAGKTPETQQAIREATAKVNEAKNALVDHVGRERAEEIHDKIDQDLAAEMKAKPDAGSSEPVTQDGKRLTTRDEGKAAGKAWFEAGKLEANRRDDPAMGNAGDEAKGGWTAGYRKAAQAAFDAAAAEAHPAPTEGQKEAGNYQKGHHLWNGLDLTIENEKGGERSKIGPDGKTQWSVTMPAHYGYIKGTEGADGDHVDFYMGDNPASDLVAVVDQKDLKTGAFDEHKAVLGTNSMREARKIYDVGFSDGKGSDRIMGITKMTVAEFKDWLANGDMKSPISDKGSITRGPKIEDFGEKIGGARKDLAGKFKAGLSDEINTKTMGISEAFPVPDYQALEALGSPKESLALVALIRASIPRKPVSEWKAIGWGDQVNEARARAAAILDGDITNPAAIPGTFSSWELDRLKTMAQVMEHLPLTDYHLGSQMKALNSTEKVPFKIQSQLPGSHYSNLMSSETAGEAASKVKALVEAYRERMAGRASGGERAPVELKVYQERASKMIFIGFKGASVVRLKEGFPNFESAHQFIKANKDELLADAEQLRDGMNERGKENLPRKGPAHRTTDATPEMFTKAFGFRGVEFGNWLAGADRQKALNDAYDALSDLAGVLNVPSTTLSLDGQLGLAFGARGRGGRNPAAAHYEQSKVAINLTKNSGAGSLAHEWFHAVDNYFAKLDAEKGTLSAAPTGGKGMRSEFMTDRKRYTGALTNEDYNRFVDLRDAMKGKNPWYQRSVRYDGARSAPYYSTTIELAARAFEKMVVDRLASRGMTSDYLANIDQSGGAYPTTTEMRRFGIAKAFDHVLGLIERDLGAKGGPIPKLPPVDPSLLKDGPQAGDTWESPEGTNEIVDRNGDMLTVKFSDGQTKDMELWRVEKLMDLDAQLMDPAEIAKAKAKKEADEKREARADARAITREESGKRLDQFIAATGKNPDTVKSRLSKIYNFGGEDGVLSRAELIYRMIANGGSVIKRKDGTELVATAKGGFYGKDTYTSVGIEYAKWLVNRLAIEKSAKEAEQALAPKDQATDASGMTDDEIGAKFDEAFNSIIGPQEASDTATGTVAPDNEEAAPQPAPEAEASDNAQPEGDATFEDGSSKPRTASEAGASAADNAAAGFKDLAEGLSKLFGFDEKGRINSGFTFDEETYAKAKPFFISGVKRLGEAVRDVGEMMRALIEALRNAGMHPDAILAMRPYAMRFARDIEAGKIDFTDEAAAHVPEKTATDVARPASPDASKITQSFHDAFADGRGFRTIIEARKEAVKAIGRDIAPADYKMIEEAIEAAVVKTSREIAASDTTPAEKFAQLVDLYSRQPKLAERTSDSVEKQAYSTPAPLAYVASELAGITDKTRVLEPTAGNGMLLMQADPKNIIANELDPARAAQLREIIPGVTVTEQNAATANFPIYDTMIANPPFGAVFNADRTRQTWPLGVTKTGEVDHAIAWKALSAMPENGRAVLLLGGVKKTLVGDERAKGYRTKAMNDFYKQLYDTYNVVDHFTVSGDLYTRQGAGWPVDVVVIDGRGASSLTLPQAKAPDVLMTWDEVGRKLVDADRMGTATVHSPTVGGDGAEAGIVTSGLSGGIAKPDRGAGIASPDGKPVGGAVSGGQRGNASDLARPAEGSGADGANERPVAEQAGTGNNDLARPGEGSLERPGAGAGDRGIDAGAVSSPAIPTGPTITRENNEVETAFQVKYHPVSKAAYAVGTLLPKNMLDAMHRALARISAEEGNIDAYVARELGYDLHEMLGTEDQPGRFSAEQVDALALAIHNVNKGKGFIIGDQTGVGKGRFVAAMIRFAERKGRLPVFVTKAPGLYGDMVRDLRDIGMTDAHKAVFTTNSNLTGSNVIPLSNAAKDHIASPKKADIDAGIAQLSKNGTLPAPYKYLFTTYAQMQTVKGMATPRMNALMAAAPNAMFILDESHEAGGVAKSGRGAEPGESMGRADFFRKLTAAANGTVFSSATYAKNPSVMSLYATTDLSLSVDDLSKLTEAVERGGVPLQQVIANLLVESGQYVRRERSFDGVQMGMEVMPTHEPHAAEISSLIRTIFNLDEDVFQDVREKFGGELAKNGQTISSDGSVGTPSVTSSNFASTLHNIVSQMLLALKVDGVADRAIESWKAGEKPIIALVNTNGAILDEMVDDMGTLFGDPMHLPFTVLLDRYLDRLRMVSYKAVGATKPTRIRIPDDKIDPWAMAQFKKVREAIAAAKLDGVSGAPIDAMMDRMRAAGMKVGEITGRDKMIDGGILTKRNASDAEKKKSMNAYNAGGLDALIINQSGSTGYSMHATGKAGNDGQPRRMIVAQPDSNIDVFMQMLGRIHRTGQIHLPAYSIATSDLAVEKRISAILMRKMASLNANTTASKKGAVSLENVTDFMNKYGDQVIAEMMNNGDIPSREIGIDEPGDEIGGLAQKVTGRLAILDPKRTAEIYDQIETAYAKKIAELDALGTNDLELKYHDYQARTLARAEIAPAGDVKSPFTQALNVEQVSAKSLGKPYTMARVREIATANRPGPSSFEGHGSMPKLLESLTEAHMAPLLKKMSDATDAYRKVRDANGSEKDLNVAVKSMTLREAAVNEERSKIHAVISGAKTFSVGKVMRLNVGDGLSLDAVVIGLDAPKLGKSPAAASKIIVRFAVADAIKELALPLSRLIGKNPSVTVEEGVHAQDIITAFENGQSDSRQERLIATGNLVKGFEKFSKGQIIMYSDENGKIKNGILMPKGFDWQAELAKADVVMPDHAVAAKFVADYNGTLKSEDGTVLITRNGESGILITVKQKGGKQYYLNKAVTDIIGNFRGRGNGMTNELSGWQAQDLLARALDAWVETLHTSFAANSMKDEARLLTGIAQPQMKMGDPKAKESRIDPAPAAVTSVTRSELGNATGADLRAKAGEWYRSNLLGQSVMNVATGWDVRMTRVGSNPADVGAGDDLVRLTPAIPEIVAEGVPTGYQSAANGGTDHTIAATVNLDGSPVSVTAVVHETKDGAFQYALTSQAPHGKEMNLQTGADIVKAQSAAIVTAASDALAKTGLDGKIALQVVDGLAQSGVFGNYKAGVISLDQNEHWQGILDHETIHALRDPSIWGDKNGLFRPREWASLVAKAQSLPGMMDLIQAAYPDLSPEAQAEEAVAEMYREWKQGEKVGAAGRSLAKVSRFFEALSNGLRANGFQSSASIMENIANGDIGQRGTAREPSGRFASIEKQIRASVYDRMGRQDDTKFDTAKDFVTHAVTSATPSLLGLVPGDRLFNEIGKDLMSAKTYAHNKMEMDALRGEWQTKANAVTKEWVGLMRNGTDGKATLATKANPWARRGIEDNTRFMDLMHQSTITGVDPSKPDAYRNSLERSARDTISRIGADHPDAAWANAVMDQARQRREDYRDLKSKFDALPKPFQDLYSKVRNHYAELSDAIEAAVIENIKNGQAMALRTAEKAHAKALDSIEARGLEGSERDEAVAKADEALQKVKDRSGWGLKARMANLRAMFESNRLQGPYFPLARFGDHFVTVRDENRRVVSFNTFESEAAQQAFAKDAMREATGKVEVGILSDRGAMRKQVDPAFVADVQQILGETNVDEGVLDAIWQKYLETLPSASLRKNRLHRGAVAGYNADALRTFASKSFHGAHQLARLTYGLPLQEALDNASDEAAKSQDPVRMGRVVQEMALRHEFTMNPTSASAISKLSNLAFIYDLGFSPAAAIRNLSQTTMVSIPLMGARFEKTGWSGAAAAVTKAGKDYFGGRGGVQKSNALSSDEQAAMKEIYRRGIISRDQVHELASLGRTGTARVGAFDKVMTASSFFFQKVEVLNREVTALATYRIARAEGFSHENAIDEAADMTFKTHFDHQNSSRPRYVQSSVGKLLTIFRQFHLNMLYRFFRDMHQSFAADSSSDRRLARRQVTSLAIGMMLHAGITGVFGYGLIMTLLGMVWPKDSDGPDVELQKALLGDAAHPHGAVWNYLAGALIHGLPTQITGADVGSKIGLPNMWFQPPSRDLSGVNLYNYYLGQLAGPLGSIVEQQMRGIQTINGGNTERGIEQMVPKTIRDAMKVARYATEGATTMKGETLVKSVTPYEAIIQALGYSPEKISERYDINNNMMNEQTRITAERKGLQTALGTAAMSGKPIPQGLLDKLTAFNDKYPMYPITNDTIRQSISSRVHQSSRNQFGLVLNPKLNDAIRANQPATIYN